MVIDATTERGDAATAHATIAQLPHPGALSDLPGEIAWSDSRLVTECLAGDERAWTALVEKYKHLIYSIPLRQAFTPADASDIFQSVVAELLSNLGNMRDARALPAWLIQVTSHKCSRWKKLQARELPSSDEEPQMELAAGTMETPESLVNEAEREQILREAVYRASPRCRELIRMLFYETPMRPYAEVAANLGIAVGSIGFIRRRCLDRMRKFLDGAGFTTI